MQFEELKELVKSIYKTTNSLSETGRILRDKYLILNFKKQYGVKLGSIIQTTIPDVLYNRIKNFIKFRKHIEKNKRDLKNKIKYEQELKKINILIFNLKKQKLLEERFTWTPVLSETIVNKFVYNA